MLRTIINTLLRGTGTEQRVNSDDSSQVSRQTKSDALISDSWFEVIDAESSISQGELVFGCPILVWRKELESETLTNPTDFVRQSTDIKIADLVIMSQTCDLEHAKLQNVLVCPHHPLSQFREVWKSQRTASGLKANSEEWGKFGKDVKDGKLPHKWAMNEDKELDFPFRVVDFHDVYTLPVAFVQKLVQRENAPVRYGIKSPYREALSAAFGNYFARVAIPAEIKNFK